MSTTNLTRRDSLAMESPKSPSGPFARPVTLSAPCQSPKSPLSPSNTSSHNPSNKLWIQEKQRRLFLHHLTQWSLHNDTSPYFHGTITVLQDSLISTEIALTKSVACTLTENSFTGAKKRIIIRLFPPHETLSNLPSRNQRKRRRDSMDSLSCKRNFCEWQRGVHTKAGDCYEKTMSPPRPRDNPHGYYKLVVRCGAGWVSAREYFSKLHFKHLEAKVRHPHMYRKNQSASTKQLLVGKDIVSIQPLFHPFRRLPAELQEMILKTAAGHQKAYSMCSDTDMLNRRARKGPSPISLSTMFQISKAMNVHLVPHIFRSTDFNFGLTGFTNFLWQAGPVNRREIRRLTFHFGKLALLHCIRWLAPDAVFEILEPPVVTPTRALPFFWRCQIQDLARELNLHTLTVDLKDIPASDIPMVICILQGAFASIAHMQFVETDKLGDCKPVQLDDDTVRLVATTSWRDMCLTYLQTYRSQHYYFKWNLMNLSREEYETLLDAKKEFF